MQQDSSVEKMGPTVTEAVDGQIEGPGGQDGATTQTLHGPRLWALVAVLYLGLYLLALELTMLATVIPTLTNEFHTVADISWYETAYVVTL